MTRDTPNWMRRKLNQAKKKVRTWKLGKKETKENSEAKFT